VRVRLPPIGPASLLLGRLPSGRLAAPPFHAGGSAAEPWWRAALGPLGNCVRMPVLHDTIPGRAALSGVPALLPAGGTGRPLSPLRRGGDRRRSRRGGGVMPLAKERQRGRVPASDPRAPGIGFGFIASRAMVSWKGRGRRRPDPPPHHGPWVGARVRPHGCPILRPGAAIIPRRGPRQIHFPIGRPSPITGRWQRLNWGTSDR
jgi:hypothetical protein